MKWDVATRNRAVSTLAETLSVKEAAKRLGVKPTTLAEAFRAHGMSKPSTVVAFHRADQIKRFGSVEACRASRKKRILEEEVTFTLEARTRTLAPRKKTVAGPSPAKAPRLVAASSYSAPFTRNDDSKVYVVVSDVHVPYQSKEANAAVCDLMRDIRPDGLVVDGDFLDLIEVSRHATASVAQLEGLRISKSFDAGNDQLDDYFDAGGPQMKDNHFIDGNHEDRLRRWIASGDNAVWLGDESVSIAKRLRFKERGVVYHEGYPKAHVKLGHLLITHGRWCNKYAAATHMDRYGHAVLVGHVHASGMHRGSALEKQKAGYVQGHMGDANSVAMSYAPVPNNWSQGFSIVTVEKNGNFHVQLVDFVDGAFYYGGRRYGRASTKKAA